MSPIEFTPGANKAPKIEKKKVSVEDVTLFGDKLREARRLINKSTPQVAKELGINQKTVSAWENGEKVPG